MVAALGLETAERVEYVPVRVADRPTMDRPDYRVWDWFTLNAGRSAPQGEDRSAHPPLPHGPDTGPEHKAAISAPHRTGSAGHGH